MHAIGMISQCFGMSETMNPARSDLYWAVVEHVRTWLGADGAFRRVIDAKQGILDGVTLRRISMIYGVNRGIRANSADGVNHADALAELLNKARPWPTELIERANKCLEIAKEAKKLDHTSGIQASAITKFSWFAQPDGWTVYDHFVARAMGIKSGQSGERMVRFYRKLHDRGFLALAGEVQTVLEEVQFIGLHGTRVLDKLMMLTGAEVGQEQDWAKNIRLECRGFLSLLPGSWRQGVEELAEHVERRVDTTHFLKG